MSTADGLPLNVNPSAPGPGVSSADLFGLDATRRSHGGTNAVSVVLLEEEGEEGCWYCPGGVVGVEDGFGGEDAVAVFGFGGSGVAAPLVVDPFALDWNGATRPCWAADRYGEEVDFVAAAGSGVPDRVVGIDIETKFDQGWRQLAGFAASRGVPDRGRLWVVSGRRPTTARKGVSLAVLRDVSEEVRLT
jgi:hypothetical protein